MGIKNFLWKSFDAFRKNLYWFFFKLFMYKPKVLSLEDTIRLIIEKNLSVSRFGDGEFRLMIQKGDIGFQEANERLSKALISSFNERDERLMICSFNFNNRWKADNPAGRWLQSFVFYKYKDINKLFDKKYTYGDASFTRFYNPYLYNVTDFDYLENVYIPLLKMLWKDKKVLIVEGKQTKLGIGNDLFDNCVSIRRILCPSKNAFDKYNEIYTAIIENRLEDELVLIALGPTASVLSVDLTINERIQCIDVGHIDIVYLWFLNRSKRPELITDKYVNEANNESESIELKYDRDRFVNQVICFVD